MGISAANDLAFDGVVLAVAAADDEIDCLPLVEGKQHLRRDWIVAVVLLENMQRAPIRIAQDNRIRLQMRGYPSVLRFIDSGLQVQWHMLARNKEILVVNS